MRLGGKILSRVMEASLKFIRPGISLLTVEQFASDLIQKMGGRASFKMVPAYRWATCINVNEGVVHGIPILSKKISGGGSG